MVDWGYWLELNLWIRQEKFQAVSCVILVQIDVNAPSVNVGPVALSVCHYQNTQEVAARSQGGRHQC